MSTKQRVALTSIAASAGLTAAKAAVGFATGSLAILSEAAHSLIDLAATVMTYFAVRIADQPAEATLAAFAVIAISIVVDFLRSRVLYQAAAEHASEALEADALHFSSDMWSSAAVLVGLAGLKLG